MTISEVAIESGFHSLTYFTKCFNDYYGVPPSKFSKIEVTVTYPYVVSTPPEKPKIHTIKVRTAWILAALVTIISAFLFIVFRNPAGSNSVAGVKSIAVLPFSDSSADVGNTFLVDGLMNEIRYKLGLVGDLTVLSRTSVENYRNSGKSIEEIGHELDVNYILVCRVQIIQDRTWIRLQLFDAVNNKILWSEPFEKEISLDNIFEVQKEAALIVIDELKAELTSDEKEQIERIPTENITAYNLYLLGKNYKYIQLHSLLGKSSFESAMKAKKLFEQAIELDSTFVDAYTALASIYIKELYQRDYRGDYDKKRAYLDSGLAMLEKALFFDIENVFALKKKADYYMIIGSQKDADLIYEKLSKHSKISYEYFEDDVMQFPTIKDYYSTLVSFQNYLRLKPDEIPVSRFIAKNYICFSGNRISGTWRTNE